MIVETIRNEIRYTLTNEGISVGDVVFPLAQGRCTEDGGWVLHEIDYASMKNTPHTILNLSYSSDSKPYEVQTDKGFGPVETYFKIIKREFKQSVFPFEWIQIL